MTDLAGAVQIAVYNALIAVQGLPPVVSEVPVGADDAPVYPFVLLGDDTVTQIGSKTHRVERHEVAVHYCAQSTSKLDVRAGQELIRSALHGQMITAPGASLGKPEALTQTTPLLEDGATYVGSQLFVILAQDA